MLKFKKAISVLSLSVIALALSGGGAFAVGKPKTTVTLDNVSKIYLVSETAMLTGNLLPAPSTPLPGGAILVAHYSYAIKDVSTGTITFGSSQYALWSKLTVTAAVSVRIPITMPTKPGLFDVYIHRSHTIAPDLSTALEFAATYGWIAGDTVPQYSGTAYDTAYRVKVVI